MNTFSLIIIGSWFFYFGCAMGSFYNVLIDRLPNDQDVVKLRSECTFCHTTLKWYDLFPIFSFLFVKGRCRYCNKKLSYQYLFSEIAVGALFLTAFLLYTKNIDLIRLIFHLTLWSMLFIVAVMDQKYQIIIDQVLIAFAIIGVVIQLTGQYLTISEMLFGAAVGFIFYGIIYLLARLLYKREAFGFGDVLLLAALGVFFGPIQTLVIGFLSFYCCIIFIILNIFQKKKSSNARILPFGPSVCLAAFIMSIWSKEIINFLSNLLGF